MIPPSIRRAWRQQLDNPALPIVAYLAVVGLLALASGGVAPDSVERTTPQWLTNAWALSLALGGVTATAGCLAGRTRAESAGLTGLLFGLGLYGLAEAVLRWPLGLETTSALVALMGCCLIRMRVLHLARKAVSLASEAQRGGAPPWTS